MVSGIAPGRTRSCLRTTCVAASVGPHRWRVRNIDTSDRLCQYHAKQHGYGQRHCGSWGSPGIGGGGTRHHPVTCQSATSASYGPQSGALPSWAWPWAWLSAWVSGWLGGVARFFYSYREVFSRAALTVVLLAVIRCGHFIPVPGIDLSQVPSMAASTAGERLIKALYGQAQDIPASLFDLGISPFINASILLAVLLVLPPETTAGLPGMGWLARLREARKEGRTGEAAINTTTNQMALGFALYLGLVRAFELEPCAVFGGGGMFLPQTVLALVAGSTCIHMCASTITAFGLGNGSSLVICASIITEYASTLHTVLSSLDTCMLAPTRLVAMLGGYLAMVLASVWLSTAELRLPLVQYATSAPPPPDARGGSGGGLQDLIAQARILAQKKSVERSQRSGAGAGVPLYKQQQQQQQPATGGGSAAAGGGAAASSSKAGGARPSEYFPLQLSSNGMMSIVLGGAAYFGFLPKLVELMGIGGPGGAAALADSLTSPLGLVGYGLTVAALEFLPLGGVNPKEMAEYFNMMNVGLKGVVPGEPTEQELRTRLLQCKFWGGACLGCLAVAAQLYDSACVQVLGTSLGTTSLLIIVGAVLQTARQVEGLLEGPKLQRKLDRERAAIQSLSLL